MLEIDKPDPGNSSRGFKAVLWDMDGTLLDSEKIWDIALAELAIKLGGVLRPSVRAATIGNSMVSSLKILYADLALSFDEKERESSSLWLRTRTAELFDKGIPWRPGAQDLLEAVFASGTPMALVTNTERELTRHALKTLGTERFTATVCGDEVPFGKPAPDIYRRAATLLGVDPAQCLAVEDSPTGVRAAEAAGCVVLVVPCEVPVESTPSRIQRNSLVGVSVDELSNIWSKVANAG
ncbi:MAG: HAD family hydrolase [Mycobacteriaceae bacterium]